MESACSGLTAASSPPEVIASQRRHRLASATGVDHWFLVIGLLFLMVVAVLPFGTALLAEYIGQDHGREQVALVLFTLWQLLLSVIANVSLRYAAANGRLLKPGSLGPDLDRHLEVPLSTNSRATLSGWTRGRVTIVMRRRWATCCSSWLVR